MNVKRAICAATLLWLPRAAIARTQSEESSPRITAPPKLLLLVHQSFQPGKASARQKLEVAMSRACDRLAVPNSWIDLESITGQPEALSFDPFDSFEQVEKAGAQWGRIYSGHSEVARLQEEIRALVLNERTVIALRRDDAGYRANSIDLSKARVMRVLEVRLHPGHENDFIEAFKTLAAAYEKVNLDAPWVVYQVNAGMPSPAFLVFVPMSMLRQNDNLLARRKDLLDAQGEAGVERIQQIARESYASMESNLYAISPETSHVTNEFAAGDWEFWSPKRVAGNANSSANRPAGRKKQN
jgi:hypothetical protein